MTAGVAGLARARPLSSPALLPRSETLSPASFPSLPPSRVPAGIGGRVPGVPLLWPLTPPSRREAASHSQPGDQGAGGRGVVLPSAARSPVGTGGSAPPASPSELVALLVRLRSPSSQMLQPLCSLPEGEVGSVLGVGPGARPATPAGGLARDPLLGGGDWLGCPSLHGRRSRGACGEQSQPGGQGCRRP